MPIGATHSKRWHQRTPRWLAPTDRDLFDRRRYSVDVLRDPRAFVREHHYAGTMSSSQISVGLFGPGARLVGVAVIGDSAGPAVLPKYGGPLASSSAELGRFVLLPDVAYNGETWFLARAFKLATREKGHRVILSFADPIERRAGDTIVKPQHWGTIYQASNALHLGRALPRTHLVCPDGQPVSPRGLSKLCALKKGWKYVERQLLTAGAPRRAESESTSDWIRRIRRAPGFTTQRHPGNLVYVFGLDDIARATLRAYHADRIAAYPRRAA